MTDCVFCKIVKGDIPGYKIWEDDDFIAIIDKFPKIKGQVLIISREHLNSDILELPKDKIEKFLSAAVTVSQLMKKGLKIKRMTQAAEGLEVAHAHIKLFPVYSQVDYATDMGDANYQLEDKQMADFAAKIKKGGE